MEKPLVIDLTQTLEENIPLAQILPPLRTNWVLSQQRGDFVNCQSLILSEHTGTHMDVPRHIQKNGKTVDNLPPTVLCGPILKFDLTYQRKVSKIDLESIRHIEKKNRMKTQKGSIILLHTGHSRLWRTGEKGKAYLKDRPYISFEAAHYFIGKGIRAIGMDMGGPDPLGSNLPIHKLLLGKEVFIIESLCNLDKIPAKGYIFMGVPLKIKGGTGSPIRALALSPLFLKKLIDTT